MNRTAATEAIATANIDHTGEKNDSYKVRVRRGDRVVALRPILASKHDGNFENYEYTIVPAGTVITVTSESNAGFRGIEFHANVGDGFRIPGCSTGAVRYA